MYCKTCGAKYDNENAIICVKCGAKRGEGNKYCHNCGAELEGNPIACPHCGSSTCLEENRKSRIAAGLLGILLGTLGAHNFYLGNSARGTIQLCITLVSLLLFFCTFGLTSFFILGVEIWGMVEGILILLGKIDHDAAGYPLKS